MLFRFNLFKQDTIKAKYNIIYLIQKYEAILLRKKLVRIHTNNGTVISKYIYDYKNMIIDNL